MMMNEDFNKQAWVYLVDGYKRSWKTLWLFREPKLRRVFIGHVNLIRKDYQGSVIELVDNTWRKYQNPYIKALNKEYEGIPLLRPELYDLDTV